MKTIGFETIMIQGKESILVVDHDNRTVREILPAAALKDWLAAWPPAWAAEGPAEAGAATPAPAAPTHPTRVLVDLIPAQIEGLRAAFPEAALRVYRNAIPHQIGAEEIRRLEQEYGDTTRNMGAQRHIAAVRYAFDERQLSIAAGKLTLQFVTQDLRLSKDKVNYLKQLFDFCQHFLLPDPALREHVEAFLESEVAASLPESAELLRKYLDLICPEEEEEERPLHLIKDTWLKQVERGDEEVAVSYDEVVEKLMAFSVEEE